MIRFIKSCLVFLVAVQVTGCAFGGLAKMQETDFVSEVDSSKALVNFVRPRVFSGDGANVDVWDGDRFVGTLGAGRMIQYVVSPGEHTFMTYVQGSWGIAKGDLISGKKYYLKFNSGFGFTSLGVAESDDPRIDTWNKKLVPVSIEKLKSSNQVPNKRISKAREILKEVESGTAKYSVITEDNAI